jgi:regulator of vacuolar morphogenesis
MNWEEMEEGEGSAMNMSVSIPGYSESTPTYYTVQVSIERSTYNVMKRYSDFEEFHTSIEQEMGERAPVDLPPKKWIGNRGREFLEDRRRRLEIYLRSMAKREEWRDSLAFQQFVEVTKHMNQNKTELNKGEWTRKVTEAKDFIHRASQAGGGADERKYSVMAGAKIKELENHLVGNHGLGDGEYRRRKDLLHDLSRSLLNINKGAASDSPMPSSGTVSSLFNTSSKRVLGGGGGASGGAETDRTRDLNNADLMVQQKDDMSDQDQVIQLLRSTIQRQRELGEQINEEIVNQNQLLDELDADTHQFSSRLNQAKKRVSKFT